MRNRVLDIAALIAGVDIRSPKARAIDIALEATRLGAAKRPPWWQWTCWLACAITCRRIEAA